MEKEKERLSRFAGNGRPSRSFSFRDVELQPALLWDAFPSLPTKSLMVFFSFIVTASTCQTPSCLI